MKFWIRVVKKSIVALKKFEGKKDYEFLRKCFFCEKDSVKADKH